MEIAELIKEINWAETDSWRHDAVRNLWFFVKICWSYSVVCRTADKGKGSNPNEDIKVGKCLPSKVQKWMHGLFEMV